MQVPKKTKKKTKPLSPLVPKIPKYNYDIDMSALRRQLKHNPVACRFLDALFKNMVLDGGILTATLPFNYASATEMRRYEPKIRDLLRLWGEVRTEEIAENGQTIHVNTKAMVFRAIATAYRDTEISYIAYFGGV